MVSTRPYLLRALYEWCVDQGYTPYLAVIVDGRTRVPSQYVKNGQIVLNIGPEAAHQLSMGNEFVTLMARFGGVAHTLSVPVDRIAAIYARENGHGMAFEVDDGVVEVGPAEAADQPSHAAEQLCDAATESPPEPDRPRPRLVRIK